MRAITFRAGLTNGETVEMAGYPTATTGLVVNLAYKPCPPHAIDGDCWIVTHVRSGAQLGFCWPSPEPAGEFAARLDYFGDWTLPYLRVRSHVVRPWQDEIVSIARGLGAEYQRHVCGIAGEPMDNGVIA